MTDKIGAARRWFQVTQFSPLTLGTPTVRGGAISLLSIAVSSGSLR
jgi:hypothetical protein